MLLRSYVVISCPSISKTYFMCPPQREQIPIPFTGNNFTGIFNYLTYKTNGNICKNGTIRIQASSNQSDYKTPANAENLCDFKNFSMYSMWSPECERNAYILVQSSKIDIDSGAIIKLTIFSDTLKLLLQGLAGIEADITLIYQELNFLEFLMKTSLYFFDYS